jgi:hypothetical protein
VEVRTKTAEPTNSDPYTDEKLGSLIDLYGVTGAVVKVWEEKAAAVSSLVNVSEAGASHSSSDLFKHAEAMLKHWTAEWAGETTTVLDSRPRVKKIVRSG